MNELEKKKIINYGTKNKNSRIYLDENVDKSIEEVPVYIGVDKKDVIGNAKISYKSDGIYAEACIIDDNVFKLINKGKSTLVSCGIGELCEDNITIKDYELTNLFPTKDPA